MTPEEKAAKAKQDWSQAVADAKSPEAMWYRYTFEGDYRGEAIKLDQMVYCPIRSFSGGSLGQSTPYSIRAQHPMTIAQQMGDGSQVLVRIPDVCQRYRAYKAGEGFQQGWEAEETINALPYVIWSDAYPDATRLEAYVSPTYYDRPGARLKIANSKVHLLPLGSHPDDVEAILKQLHAMPYAPNPRLSPKERAEGWKWRPSTGYYSENNQFISFYQVPIVDLNEYARQFMITRPDLDRDFTYDEDEGFSDPNVVAFDEASGPKSDFGNDPTAITHDCVAKELADVMGGHPLETDLPYDRIDPNWRKNPALENSWVKRKQLEANCFDRLAQLQSFAIIDGRFDASRSIPGVLIYNRWGQVHYDRLSDKKRPAKSQYGPIKMQEMGLVTPDGYRMRLRGHEILYQPKPLPGRFSFNSLFEVKESEQWFSVRTLDIVLRGKGEANHF